MECVDKKIVLHEKIKSASTAYYLGDSIMSDIEFDDLVSQLKSIDPDDPLLKQVGWGLTLYGDRVKLPSNYIYGLNKVQVSDLINDSIFLQSRSKLIELTPKYDGLSVICIYRNGYLYKLMTRGNGDEGIDITPKSNYIKDLPLNRQISKFSDNTNHALEEIYTGELIIDYPTFNNYLINKGYANPRNAVSGIINSKSIEYLEYVRFLPHDYCKFKINFINYSLDLPFIKLDNDNHSEVVNNIHEFYNKIKSVGELPIDGLVLRDHNKDTDESHSPIAIKFPTDAIEVTIKEVEWNLSNHGKYIPVIKFDSVNLYGTQVSRASAYHYQYIKDNKLGKGSRVLITKANEIIPYIVKVTHSEGYIDQKDVIQDCEIDGVHLIKTESDDDYEFKILHNFLNNLLNKKGFMRSSDVVINLLKIRTFQELVAYINGGIDFSEVINESTVLKGINREFQYNLVNSLREPIKVNSLFSLFNFNGIGPETSNLLDDYVIRNMVDFTKVKVNKYWDNILNRDRNRLIIRQCLILVDTCKIILIPKSTDSTNKIKVCLSGKFQNLTKDALWRELSQRYDLSQYVLVDYIDDSVSYLIVGDKSKISSKNKIAQKFNIPIGDATDFSTWIQYQ